MTHLTRSRYRYWVWPRVLLGPRGEPACESVAAEATEPGQEAHPGDATSEGGGHHAADREQGDDRGPGDATGDHWGTAPDASLGLSLGRRGGGENFALLLRSAGTWLSGGVGHRVSRSADRSAPMIAERASAGAPLQWLTRPLPLAARPPHIPVFYQ